MLIYIQVKNCIVSLVYDLVKIILTFSIVVLMTINKTHYQQKQKGDKSDIRVFNILLVFFYSEVHRVQ